MTIKNTIFLFVHCRLSKTCHSLHRQPLLHSRQLFFFFHSGVQSFFVWIHVFFNLYEIWKRINVVFVRYTQRDLWVKDGACYRRTLTTDHATNMRTRTVAARQNCDHSVVWDWEPRCVNLSCCFDNYSMKSEWTQLVVSQFHRRTITTDDITPPLDTRFAR